MVLSDQLFDFLWAFRKGHGCHTTLLRLLEDQLWTRIVMWQLFWWIFRKLLIICHMTFFSVNYGLSSQSVRLLENNLTGRKQQIKLQGLVCSWQIWQKCVFQGSIMGLFNMVHCTTMLMTTPYHMQIKIIIT
jgi:hypothetical protein